MPFTIIVGVYFLCAQHIASINAECRDDSYYNSTTCVLCPINCATCVSETQCTSCKNGFHGNHCKTPCIQNCTYGCHRQYGHCTYGCQDGQFASEKLQGCLNCPETCSQCSSTLNCFTCQNGFYGTNCSEMCPHECANRACNKLTGHCLKCKYGHFKHDGNCFQCPMGCTTCDNTTHCFQCQETHAGPFQGKCVRKCSEKSKHFVSKYNKRCGIAVDTTQQHQSVCPVVNLNQSYTCYLRYCIYCRTVRDECLNRTTTEGHVCLGYERCNTECNQSIISHAIQDGSRKSFQALCEQTSLIYHVDDDRTEQMCDLTTDGAKSSIEEIIEYISCFQEPEVVVDFSDGRQLSMHFFLKDTSMPVAVFVLVVTVVKIILMITTVVYLQRRWKYSDKYRLTREVEHGGSTPECIKSHRQCTPAVYLTPQQHSVGMAN